MAARATVTTSPRNAESRRSLTNQPWPAPVLHAPSAWLAFLIPAFLALYSADGSPRWMQDVDVVRVLGLVQVGAEGAISGALGALTVLLPVGGRLFRASLVNVFAIGVAALLLYHLVLRQLSGRGIRKNLHVLLALAASLMAALSVSWQTAGSRVGGPLLGSLLLWVSMLTPLQSRANWVVQGWLLGLCAGEQHSAAVCLAVSLLARVVVAGRLPSPSKVLQCVSVAVLVLAVCLLPGLLEPLSQVPSLNFGLELKLPALATTREQLSLLGELGIYMLTMAGLGLLGTLIQPSQRALAVASAAVVAVAVLVPAPGAHLCAIGAASLLAAQGTLTLAVWLAGRRLPFAGQAVRLMVVFHLGVLLMIAEQGRQSLTRQSLSATRTWSDEAFERLPPSSLLMVQTPDVAWRLWSARVSQGTRPDILLVPSRLLSHGNLAAQLLTAEPQLAPLVRDVAVTGVASEYALSQLADTRPLKVELNTTWDRQLLAHLAPSGLWLDFAPHAVGRTDREEGLKTVRRSVRAIKKDAVGISGTDWVTLNRLRQDLHSHALVLLALGDREGVTRLSNEMIKLDPSHPELERLLSVLKKHPRGAISLRELEPH